MFLMVFNGFGCIVRLYDNPGIICMIQCGRCFNCSFLLYRFLRLFFLCHSDKTKLRDAIRKSSFQGEFCTILGIGLYYSMSQWLSKIIRCNQEISFQRRVLYNTGQWLCKLGWCNQRFMACLYWMLHDSDNDGVARSGPEWPAWPGAIFHRR